MAGKFGRKFIFHNGRVTADRMAVQGAGVFVFVGRGGGVGGFQETLPTMIVCFCIEQKNYYETIRVMVLLKSL